KSRFARPCALRRVEEHPQPVGPRRVVSRNLPEQPLTIEITARLRPHIVDATAGAGNVIAGPAHRLTKLVDCQHRAAGGAITAAPCGWLRHRPQVSVVNSDSHVADPFQGGA